MRIINIKIVLDEVEEKIATAIETTGYDSKVLTDQFELLGIIENLKSIIQQRIKKLADIKK